MEEKIIKFTTVEEKLDFIEAICSPIRDFLIENYNPYTEIIISHDGIELKSTEIRIPCKE